MCKRFLLSILLIGISKLAFVQNYGNEWINYNQPHFKFKVYESGIYRISYATLQSNGFLNYGASADKWQIFGKGEEIYLHIEKGTDGLFNSGDYIEFYAEKNDGWFDAGLFKYPSFQANKYYSLFNDTATYYLTYHPTSLNNRRLIPENDIAFSSYPATSSYFYHELVNEYHTSYLLGETNSHGVTDAAYTEGESWVDAPFSLGGSTTKTIAINNTYSSGSQQAEAIFCVVGASDYVTEDPDHHLKIELTSSSPDITLVDTTYEGYCVHRFYRNIDIGNLSASTQFKFLSIDDLSSGADRNAVAYIYIKYPHTYNLENKSDFRMLIPDATGQNKSRINISGLSVASGDSVRLYDLTNHKRIKVVKTLNDYQALIPNSGAEKRCYITNDGKIKNISTLVPVTPSATFTNYKTEANTLAADYLLITHNKLMVPVDAYKSYRNNSGYNTLVVDIEHLYDQYAYGIKKNPLAIRNFIHHAYDEFSTFPEYLFLVGKSYRAGPEGILPSYRKNEVYYENTLVPTYGIPPSDILMTAGLLDTLFQPALATGRLSTRHPDTVQIYLDKVMLYESVQNNPEPWQKNVLHFGSQETFLNQLTDIIEDTSYGAFVRTFLKTSSAPIQYNLLDSLKSVINNGVSIMTFFGHAAGVGFDVSIDHPSEYSNYGKYPFILANSCWAGDIFAASSGDFESSSEEFVLIQDKGAIAYLSSVTEALSGNLNIYSNEFYRRIGAKSYGKSLGKCIKETIETTQYYPNMRETCLEMTLHGDPAIRVNSWDQADYSLKEQNIFFNPAEVSSELDSFDIHIVPYNYGKALDTTIYVEVRRTFQDQSYTDTLFRIDAPYFKDTIILTYPLEKIRGIGQNVFTVKLDLFIDEIDEYDDLVNNQTEKSLFIKSADIIPVYPYQFAIVPDNQITLKASVGFPFSSAQQYIFEIDTSDLYNSPLKLSQTINQAGGVLSWTPPLQLTDSTVYFWRVSIDSSNGNYNWRQSSFQYIPNQTGWSQAHFFQFENNNYQYLNHNRTSREFEFVNDFKRLLVQTGVYPNIPDNEVWYKINTELKNIWTCLNKYPNFVGINFAVFDTIGFEPWVSQLQSNGLGQYGNVHCKSHELYTFDFYTDSAGWRQKIIEFIDTIPQGYYVLAYSVQNHNAENYESDLVQAFKSIGSGSVENIQNNQPYILFGRKGAPPGSVHEEVGFDEFTTIQLEDSVQTKWNEGYMISSEIGPASQWNSLHWKTRARENPNPATDEISLYVLGLAADGSMDTLIGDLPPDSSDIYNLDAYIPPAYNRIKLLAKMKDDSLHTPGQMIKWQIMYEGVPETAINPIHQYIFYSDTLQEGEEIFFSTATENISPYDMDSLLISYKIYDNGLEKWLMQKRLRPHPAGDVLIDSLYAPTTGLSGINSIWMEVNPLNTSSGNYDQPEQYHFNNIGEFYFFVMRDKVNPVLDVTFDGVHILDGDIVSAKPLIQISLSDENEYFILTDTSSFRVWIEYPGGSPVEIYFWENNQEKMRFIPASLPNNKCRIEYNAEFTDDGEYQLLIQARDKSGNVSGEGEEGRFGNYDYDYKINFEVINKATITEVMNWPNPFSTSTRFVFTLTGSELPTEFRIQIMTVTGRIVREIELYELGPIHIGRNITEYAWDGKDEFGDQLANGVYLYRIITNINETAIEKNQTSASKYFVKDFGKMVLIR